MDRYKIETGVKKKKNRQIFFKMYQQKILICENLHIKNSVKTFKQLLFHRMAKCTFAANLCHELDADSQD